MQRFNAQDIVFKMMVKIMLNQPSNYNTKTV